MRSFMIAGTLCRVPAATTRVASPSDRPVLAFGAPVLDPPMHFMLSGLATGQTGVLNTSRTNPKKDCCQLERTLRASSRRRANMSPPPAALMRRRASASGSISTAMWWLLAWIKVSASSIRPT